MLLAPFRLVNWVNFCEHPYRWVNFREQGGSFLLSAEASVPNIQKSLALQRDLSNLGCNSLWSLPYYAI